MHATATASDDERWYTTKEAAAYTGRGLRRIKTALQTGELHGEQPGFKGHWRTQRPCLDAWVLKQPCPHHTARTTQPRTSKRGRAA